jgi:hypothetical protein
LSSPFPWQQIVDPIDRMIGDAGDDIGKPSLGVDAVEACGFDERVDDRRALAARIRSSLMMPGVSGAR